MKLAQGFLASACLLSSALPLHAAELPEQYFYFGGHVSQNWLDVGDHYDSNGDDITLAGVQAGYRFNENWSLQAWWERDKDTNTGLFGDTSVNIALASLRKHFHGNSDFEPYVGIGSGEFRAQPSGADDIAETIGALEGGFQSAIHRHLLLDVGLRPYYSFDSERWDTEVYAGLNFVFGTVNDDQAEQEEVAIVGDQDGDGVLDDADQCPNTPAGTTVDANGCAADGDDDADGVANSADQCPETPQGALIDANGCQQYLEGDIRHTLYVKFEHGNAEVSQASYAEIEALAVELRNYPSTNITLDGHTDSSGSESFNQRLSEQRSAAVKKVLVERFEIDAARIQAIGHGESSPIADNSTAEGRAKNRRVETLMQASQRKAQFQQ